MTLRLPVRTYGLAALLMLLLAACDGGADDGPSPTDFDRPALLDHLARDVIVPSYEALQQVVVALDDAAAQFAAEPSAARLDAVQNRLHAARLAWQDANLFQFGPAESVTLRAALNTYPADPDRIEANVASGSYILGALDNRAAVGFPALDYLLHGADDEAVLAAFADTPNRRAYLLDNVAFIRQAVDAVVDGWDPDGGDYLGTFLSEANAGTDVGSSPGMLINAYVLHYERFIRDGKIGIPAGVRSAGVPRPAATEAYHAGYSAELALANLRAARRLFLGDTPTGTTGLGLDDYLQALDADALAAEITTAFDEAVDAVDALGDPLAAQIAADNAPVLAAFTELQDVVVLLKADMTSVLGVTITFQDNDGD